MIIKSKNEQRCYKDCECCECGKVSKCTPTNDYYSTNDHGDGLLCESCFREYANHKIKQ